MSPTNKEIPNRKAYNEPINRNIPIHRLRRNGRSLREEAEDEYENKIENREVINGAAPFAQTPARRRKGFVAPALDADTCDGDDVGREECGGSEGRDGVEGDCRTDVDEGEEDGDYE